MSRYFDKEAKLNSQRIDEEIRKDKLRKDAEVGVRMVCLGSADSGKSTVIKQLQLLIGTGFSETVRAAWKPIILYNIQKWGKEIAELAQHTDSPAVKSAIQHLRAHPVGPEPKSPLELTDDQITEQQKVEASSATLPQADVNAIMTVWEAVQRQPQLKATSTYMTLSSAVHFFESLGRITAPNFIPTEDDILKARVKTQQITSYEFKLNELPLRIYDVAGHKSQRHKWISFFDDVEAILFVAAVSAYDQMLEEDPAVNRMVDSLELFDTVVNNKLLRKTDVILFLNKIDLLKIKLEVSPFKSYIPAYEGPNDAKAVLKFLRSMFKRVNKTEPDARSIFVHNTHATDKKSMKAILAAVTDIIMKLNMRDTGLYM